MPGMAKKINVTVLQASFTQTYSLDLARAVDLVQATREHVERTEELARILTRLFQECYGYDDDEPNLGYCCRLVCHVLESVSKALEPLGTVLLGRDPQLLVAACERQRQQLLSVQAIVRAIRHVVRDANLAGKDVRDVKDALGELDACIAICLVTLTPIALGLPPVH